MEDGWDNDTYFMYWSEVSSVAGVFDGEPYEDFNKQWGDNEFFIWVWEMADSVIATFDEGTQDVEDFENGWNLAVTT